MKATFVRLASFALLVSCAPHPRGATGALTGDGAVVATPRPMTALQKKKAEMLTSLWENGTTVLAYAYCENIGDGRGYTSGRAGFCTGTGDAFEVVRCFDAATGPGGANRLRKYLPALTGLRDRYFATGKDQADTATLDAVGSFAADWSASATDPTTAPAFRSCQDEVVARLYFQPGLELAARWGLQTALTKAAIYDAEINHGADGVEALAAQANADTGNRSQTPAKAPLRLEEESAWLRSFLTHRAATLGADKTWAEAVDRAAEYEKLRRNGNWELAAEIVTDAKAAAMFANPGYRDSGHPRCTIGVDGAVRGDVACTK